MKRNDTLWKGILESLFPDFLQYFFKDADALFDMERGFQFLDKELEQLFPTDEIKAPKFVDKLVKVFTRSGREEWILVHVEVQGYDDKNFGERMFTYFYRILDKYEKRITSIAVYTDANKNFHPKMFVYEYLGTKVSFEFNTFKVIDQDEKSLAENDNPFATVILTVLLALEKKTLDDESLYNLKYGIAKKLLERKMPKKKIDDLLIFLQRYVTFENSGYNVKFDKEIEELTEKQKTMGIREQVLDLAKKEGIEEGKTEFVKNLLAANRFTNSEIANFAGVTEKFVLNVQKMLQ
jgi:predicted transposase/invertase (TIGR01784 family)